MTHLKAVRDYRPKELPPTWDDADGRAVRWAEWQPEILTYICPPPPPYACPECSSTAVQDRSQGAIIPNPGDMFEFPEDVPSKRRPGAYWQRTRKVPAWPVIRLSATRCPDCGHAEIYDTETDTLHVPPWDDPSEVTS